MKLECLDDGRNCSSGDVSCICSSLARYLRKHDLEVFGVSSSAYGFRLERCEDYNWAGTDEQVDEKKATWRFYTPQMPKEKR
jgi:hypothetical protein